MSQYTRVINGNAYLGIEDGTLSGLIEVAERVVSQAKSLAPVNKLPGVGGQLRNSIMYKTGSGESGGFNNGSDDQAQTEINSVSKKYEAHVGFNLLYGIYQEFGTTKMRPQPFLRPALEIEVKGGDALKVLAKIEAEKMLGALKKGQKRETFNV